MTASVTVGTKSIDVAGYERRIQSLETENRELTRRIDRPDGTVEDSKTSDDSKKLTDQVQALSKQNQGGCICVWLGGKGIQYSYKGLMKV